MGNQEIPFEEGQALESEPVTGYVIGELAEIRDMLHAVRAELEADPMEVTSLWGDESQVRDSDPDIAASGEHDVLIGGAALKAGELAGTKIAKDIKAPPSKKSKPNKSASKKKASVLDRVLDEQFEACLLTHEREAKVFGVEPLSKNVLKERVAAWFKEKKSKGRPIGAPSDQELPFSLVVHALSDNPLPDHIAAFVLALDRRPCIASDISYGILSKYDGSQLTGYPSDTSTPSNYPISLIYNRWDESLRGNVAMQIAEFTAAKKSNQLLAVPSILDLVAATYMQSVLKQPLTPESTYGRDCTLPAKKILGLVRCVPYFSVGHDGVARLGASPVALAHPIRLAKK